LRSKLIPLLHLLTVVASIGLLFYGYTHWSVHRRHVEAQRLHGEGVPQDALRKYEELGRDIGQSRWKKPLFEQEYALAVTSQLALLYELARYDQAIELADTLIQAGAGDVAVYYFWSGNALFQKGMTEEQGEDSYRWFNRAIAQLRKALEEDRNARWNIRYNYELVKTSVDEVMAKPETERAKVLRPREAQQGGGPRKKSSGSAWGSTRPRGCSYCSRFPSSCCCIGAAGATFEQSAGNLTARSVWAILRGGCSS